MENRDGKKEVMEFDDDEKQTPEELSPSEWKRAKQIGFSDAQLSFLWGCSLEEVRELMKIDNLFLKYV